jgi:CRP-like cAMP-binding protein
MESGEGHRHERGGDVRRVEREGTVRFCSRQPHRLVAACATGSLVGEIALFVETRRPATGTAIVSSDVLEIERKLVIRTLNEYPHMALRLRATLADRLAAVWLVQYQIFRVMSAI